MATNILYKSGEGGIVLRMTVGSGVVANDMVEFVELHGVAITSYSAVDGKADILLPGIDAVVDLEVLAENHTVGSAVAIGDKLYYDAAETPDEINKDSTDGKACGYALEAIDSGATDTIQVAVSN